MDKPGFQISKVDLYLSISKVVLFLGYLGLLILMAYLGIGLLRFTYTWVYLGIGLLGITCVCERETHSNRKGLFVQILS